MSLKASVGAGALVLVDDKVLLVQLNYGRFKGQWILPGGLLEPGEDPVAAAIRELHEETNQEGIEPLLHAVRFRKEPADIYWVLKMKLLSERPIEYSSIELQAVKFWKLNEALHASEVRPMTKYFIKSSVSIKPYEVEFPIEHRENDSVYFFNT